jgi:hypothetical protein
MGVPASIAPGDESPFLGFSDAVGPGVSGLLLSAPPASHPRLSTGGRWRVTQSSCVHWSLTWRGCCMIF